MPMNYAFKNKAILQRLYYQTEPILFSMLTSYFLLVPIGNYAGQHLHVTCSLCNRNGNHAMCRTGKCTPDKTKWK